MGLTVLSKTSLYKGLVSNFFFTRWDILLSPTLLEIAFVFWWEDAISKLFCFSTSLAKSFVSLQIPKRNESFRVLGAEYTLVG